MDEKRTIEELTVLYDMEPELRDIFVEGSIDKSFFDWYVRRKNWPNISIYPIDVIDIPGAILDSYKLPLGSKRSRVIALSRELTRTLGPKRHVMCIIDRDSDDENNLAGVNPFLFCTDGNSLELYALSPAVMEKFMLVGLGGFPFAAENLLAQILPILKRLYVIRQANRTLKWGMKWVSIGKYITLSGGVITFRDIDFIRVYLQKNARWEFREGYYKTLDEESLKIEPAPYRSVRGHDVAELLYCLLQRLEKKRSYGNVETIEGCLMMAIEAADIDDKPLFCSLKEVMQTAMQ